VILPAATRRDGRGIDAALLMLAMAWLLLGVRWSAGYGS